MVLPSQWTTLASPQIQSYLERSPLNLPLNLPLHSPRNPICNEGHPSSLLPPLNIHIYDQIASTNQTLWALIHQGATAGTVAIAHQQSAGKGQWGRQWISSTGGLYLSFALEPDLPIHHSPHLILSTVCGVALALRSCQLPVLIKWPNDLVILKSSDSLYKLGGILTETRTNGQSIHQAVIGIGINGANPVPDPGINLIDVWSQLEGSPQLPLPLDSLNGLAAIAIHGIRSGWHRLQSEGIDPILQDYNHLLVHRDRRIEIEWKGQSQWVHVLGVTATGELRVHPLTRNAKPPVPSTTKESDSPSLETTALGTSPRLNSFIPNIPPPPDSVSKKLTGTSSIIQASIEEIRIPPDTIQLGYRKS